MGEFPKDGSTFIVESIDRTAYRWAKYKPDGARQMGKPGRWQKQVWSGDWFKWENCEEPVGEIAPAMEDGPISAAVKALAAKDAEIARLREALNLEAIEAHRENAIVLRDESLKQASMDWAVSLSHMIGFLSDLRDAVKGHADA